MKYKKLVRDYIPHIIQEQGKVCSYRFMDDSEYFKMLLEKLLEETHEFITDESVEELADIFEVIHAIMQYKGYDLDKVKKKMREKAYRCGKFEKRIMLEEVED